jgi:nucleotide-binding universal stress UspA family protein
MIPRVLQIERILVPMDFSKPAEKALRYAVSFARQFDAKITVLHARQTTFYPIETGYLPPAIPSEELPEKVAQDRLQADVQRIVPEEMRGNMLVRVGAPFDEICTAAKELHIDLILIATHGYTGLKHVLLGSTAERVVRHAPCPVLVVREREHEFI